MRYRVYYEIPFHNTGGHTEINASSERMAGQIAIARIAVEQNIHPQHIKIESIERIEKDS